MRRRLNDDELQVRIRDFMSRKLSQFPDLQPGAPKEDEDDVLYISFPNLRKKSANHYLPLRWHQPARS